MSSRPLSCAAFAVALLAVAGCGREVPYPAKSPAPQASTLAPEPSLAPTPALEATAAPETAAADAGPIIELNDDAKRTFVDPLRGSIFDSSRRPMQECVPGKGGVLRIQIVRTSTGVAMHTDPETSLDAAERRCALEALSVVDLTEVVAESPASTQQRIYAPQITIRW